MILPSDARGRHAAAGEPLFGPRVKVINRGPDYSAIKMAPEFRALRRKQRWFIFPVALLFMAWYLTFVLLAAYAHEFMSRPVLGLINVGMVFGLLQFASTVTIMLIYCRHARRSLDPAARAVRELVEGRP